MKILTQDWRPSAETMSLLKLNQMSDEHINASLDYLKKEYVNTSIDDIPSYDSWSSLFIIFCIKASKVKES